MPARTPTAAHPHPAEQAEVTPELRASRAVGFVAAATTFVVVFVAGSMPIPLYGTYRSADGVSDTDLSLAAVAYFVLAVTGLVVLGRLSNHLGRRPVALAAVVVALAGSLVFLDVHSPGVLILGRALQGLAAGLASSAVASWAVDTAPREPRWLVATVTTASATIGLSIGAFASGLLVELAPWPRQTPFVVAAALLAACGVLVLLGPETVARTRGAWASLRPHLRLPPATRPFVPAAAAVFLSTWAIGLDSS